MIFNPTIYLILIKDSQVLGYFSLALCIGALNLHFISGMFPDMEHPLVLQQHKTSINLEPLKTLMISGIFFMKIESLLL
jgi:hypothetical protein